LVAVSYNRSEEVKYVQMQEGMKETANLISGWKEVVQLFDLRKGKICVFSFTDANGTDKKARLRLRILPLGN
jgi:putative ubiquitin-RnfH superfamily antitoxin RatB of RatAB toxin-antitoxin module